MEGVNVGILTLMEGVNVGILTLMGGVNAMNICSLGSHKMKAYIRCTSNRTVNIADAGTVYSLYTSLLCKLVLCAT